MSENTHSVLTNATGQVVFDGLHIERYDFTQLTPGLYILRSKTGEAIDIVKLLKK